VLNLSQLFKQLLMVDNAVGLGDEAVVGLSFDGAENGAAVGTSFSDNSQVPHVALQVLETPLISHESSFAISQVASSFLKMNSAFESIQVSQVSHVLGQCELTLSKSHLFSFLLLAQTQFMFSTTSLVVGFLVLNLIQLFTQTCIRDGLAVGLALRLVVGLALDDTQVPHVALQVLSNALLSQVFVSAISQVS